MDRSVSEVSLTPSLLRAALTALALVPAAGLSAQYAGEPPVLTTTPRSFPGSLLGAGVTEIGQVEFVPVPGQPIGVFYLTASVKQNGQTDWDLLTGIYDDANFPPSFTPNGDVAALNTSGDEFAGTVSNDLLVLAADTPAGPMFSVRSDASQPFPALQAIGGPVPSGYVDSKLCSLDGVESYAYVSGTDVWAADFDRTAYGAGRAPASNARRIITNPAGSQGLRAPEPMRDSAGEARSFLVSTREGGLLTAAFASSIHDRDIVRPLYQGAEQLGHPAQVGGTGVYATEGPAGFLDPTKVDFVATSSAQVASGGTAELAVWVPYRFFGPPVTVTLGLGIRASSGQAIPGVYGMLGLLPAPLITLPPQSIQPRGGVATWSVPVGTVAPGLHVDLQGVMLDSSTNQLYLGNNAVLETL